MAVGVRCAEVCSVPFGQVTAVAARHVKVRWVKVRLGGQVGVRRVTSGALRLGKSWHVKAGRG